MAELVVEEFVDVPCGVLVVVGVLGASALASMSPLARCIS